MATAGEPAACMPPSAAPFSDDLLDMVFASGNPRIEETRVIVVFHPDPPAGSSFQLPVGKKPRVCVLDVPNHITYADFCRFCGDFVHRVLEMRFVRTGGAYDHYSVLVDFDNQISRDNFYKHFNGKQFSSPEGHVCCVRYVEDVQYTQLIQHAHSSIMCSAWQHTCPVCLGRLDKDPGGVLITICNHSFHYSCILKWTDSSCPVCRYSLQQPEKSMCSICGTSENLWICLICDHVGCGRHKDCHAVQHWEKTQHCHSLELETQKVWDYAENNYMHRLIQSKTEAKLEYNCHAGLSEDLLNSKCEAIVKEYKDFLGFQLKKHRHYNESLLLEVKEENEKEISVATEKAVCLKLQKLQEKLAKVVEEKTFSDAINENLKKDEDSWKEKIQQMKAREKALLRSKDEVIENLKGKVRDLIACLEEP